MAAPEWAKAVYVDTVVETWDGILAETERELIALSPYPASSPTLASIWGKLSEDARENLFDMIDDREKDKSAAVPVCCRCCPQATLTNCVCAHSRACPEHGTKHHGTHD